MHLVLFCISLYFKFLNVLDIPGQFCCYEICHCFLISIAFMCCFFLFFDPHFLFFMAVHTFLTHWCLGKWKTIPNFSGLFRNIKTSYRVIFWNRSQKICGFNHFSPLYHHLVWSFSWTKCQAGIPSTSLAVHLCIVSLTAHQNSLCGSGPAKNNGAR